jgi:hypothetical protein
MLERRFCRGGGKAEPRKRTPEPEQKDVENARFAAWLVLNEMRQMNRG